VESVTALNAVEDAGCHVMGGEVRIMCDVAKYIDVRVALLMRWPAINRNVLLIMQIVRRRFRR
jgi:hypothetical protein